MNEQYVIYKGSNIGKSELLACIRSRKKEAALLLRRVINTLPVTGPSGNFNALRVLRAPIVS
jgi:hypothetical protein